MLNKVKIRRVEGDFWKEIPLWNGEHYAIMNGNGLKKLKEEKNIQSSNLREFSLETFKSNRWSLFI